MTTTSYNMFMEFLKGNKMNTTPYTDNEKVLMTIIEQSFTDHDHMKNELQDDNDKVEEARLKQSLKTIALKKEYKKVKTIVEEKDKTIEIMTKKIEDLEKEVIAYKYNKDPSYDPSSSEEEEDEEDEELSYEDDPDWDHCEECIVKEGEMILNMSGGWNKWGYVVTKSGMFVRSDSGHYPINGKLVWTGIGKGSYVCDKINTYSLKEGEMDVYNFFITDHKAIMDL